MKGSDTATTAIMVNEVFIDHENLIRNIYRGNQDAETVTKMQDDTLLLIDQLAKKNIPVLILTDLQKIGKTNAASRSAANKALKLMVFDKVAIYGANTFLKYVANFIIMASGRSDKVKYFDTEQEAKNWLMPGEIK
ncbi:MAG: STAS/SEC14 domain-containing protein [Bacteroidetes bacterium]|nr:STAS/SEC14 domain-containing protein [Bacteroidota bacterium]